MIADSEAHSSLSPMDLSDTAPMHGGKGRRVRKSGKKVKVVGGKRKSARKTGKQVKVVGGKRKSARKSGRKVRRAKKSRMTLKMW